MLGLVLLLLGLLTGIAVPTFTNPRMGISSHLQGMTNGQLLVVIGVMWPHVHLSQVWGVVAVALLACGAYANRLATQLGALWGAGRKFMPAAAGEHVSAAGRERVVDLLLVTLAPAMVVATVLLIIGVVR